jgi:hypothetical protein
MSLFDPDTYVLPIEGLGEPCARLEHLIAGLPFILAAAKNSVFKIRSLLRSNGASNSGASHDIG